MKCFNRENKELQMASDPEKSYGTLNNNNTKHEKIHCFKKIINFLRREIFLFSVIASVCLGLLVGLLINNVISTTDEPKRTNILILMGFPGEIFMRILKMLVLPLLITSLITGLSQLDQKSSGKLGKRALLYYTFTTIVAVVLGIILAVCITPGRGVTLIHHQSTNTTKARTMDALLDLIRNMFPENIIQACLEHLVTPVRVVNLRNEIPQINNTNSAVVKNITLKNISSDTIELAGVATYRPGTNILGIVTFSITVGVILGKMGEKVKQFVLWISILNDVILQIVNIVMILSPIGIFSLILKEFSTMKDLGSTFESLGMYLVTVLTGLFIHGLVVLPIIYFVMTRKNPLVFLRGCCEALITAFGTSSSSATLPVTLNCLEKKNNVDKRVTNFILPIGATINMDGTALYEAIAAIYIAQATNSEMSMGQYIAISLTATLASIGAAGIPQAGLITLIIVLQTVGLPQTAISLIISVDWLLDRVRTTVNVLGDCYGAGIVAHLSKEDLEKASVLREFNAEVEHLELGLQNKSFLKSFENLNNSSLTEQLSC